MPVSCFIYDCQHSRRRNQDLTFFRIPPHRLEDYFYLSGRSDIDHDDFVGGGYQKYRICSDHFDPNDYTYCESTQRKTLNQYAIPTKNTLHGRASSHTLTLSMIPQKTGLEVPDSQAELELGHDGQPVPLVKPQQSLLKRPLSPSVDEDTSNKMLKTLLQIPVTQGMREEHSYACAVPTSRSATTVVTTTTTTLSTATSVTATVMTLKTARSSTTFGPDSDTVVKVEEKDQVVEAMYSEDERYDFDVCDLPTELDDVDPEDMDFSLNMSMMAVSSSESDEEECAEVPFSSTRKHIVYQSQLLELFSQVRCSCSALYKKPSISESKGSLLLIKSVCKSCSKTFVWRSQPVLGRKSKGNVELAAAMYVTGQSFSAVDKWLKLADVQFISKTTFYNYQHSYFLPMVNRAAEATMKAARDQVNQRREPVRLAGDGRYDSPGHSARYCTYTMMDSVSGLVTHNVNLETIKSSSAVMAETDGFTICLEAAKDHFSNESPLETITTDGNTSIRSLMENQQDVIHALDVWHLCKNLGKNLANKCKKVDQKPLLKWITHITNHLWWATSACEHDEKMLLEMIFSIAYHIVGIHKDFPSHTHYRACAHPPITPEEHSELAYLKPGSEAHKVLVKHLHDTTFVRQLKLATHGQHTGKLEVLHSMMLAYVPKRIDYDPPSYTGRVHLAILDHNENVGRAVQTNADGTIKLQLKWSKAVKDYRMVKVYVPKTYHFRTNLIKDILAHAAEASEATPRYTGQTIARKDKPDLQLATQEYLKHKRM